jgi:hypothetical protein
VHTLMKESTIHNKQSSKRTASSSSAQPQQRTANANAAAIGPPTYASITKSDNRPAAAASTAPDRIESPSENRFSGHATWNEVPDGSNWS